jgi:hypothetical protein
MEKIARGLFLTPRAQGSEEAAKMVEKYSASSVFKVTA